MPATPAMSRAMKATAGMFFTELDEPNIVVAAPMVYKFNDLPFKAVTTGQTTASIKTVLFVKKFSLNDDADQVALPDLDVVKTTFMNDGMDGLIGNPVGLAGTVPAGTVQWCIIPEDDGVKVVLLMEFPKRATLALLQKAAGAGQLMQIDSTLIGSPRSVAIPVQFMFENMGGSLLMTRALAVSEKFSNSERSLSAEDIDQGLLYLNERGPTSASEILPFALREHVSSDSPLSGWQMSWIKEACRDRMENNFKARMIKDFPLTIHDLSPWCIEHLVAPVLHFVTSNSIVWAGEPGVGKTPVANAVANVVSQWHKNLDEVPTGPSFKTASDLDMYRGEIGSRCCPYIYDDGATDHDSVPRLKAFMDVSAEDAGVTTRYSGARLESNQLRQICSNSYDPDAAPPTYDVTTEMSHDSFLNIIKNVFPKNISKVDLMACLKRCACIVICTSSAVVRLPEADKVNCRVIPFPPGVKKCDLMISPAGQAKLQTYKGKGDKNLPTTFDDEMTWSLKLLEWCLSDKEAFGFVKGIHIGKEERRSLQSINRHLQSEASPQKRARISSPVKQADTP
eukprot:179181-Amphidinium_carterae.1